MKGIQIMTKREIMVRAWEIARELVGDLSARLSMAMKQAWEESKGSSIVAKLKNAGGKVWDKKGHRIYISRIWKNLFKVEMSFYKRSGMLQSFYLNNEHWSNCQAQRLMSCFETAYFDVDSSKWVGMDSYDWVFKYVK